MTPRSANSRPGATLIELLVVMSIIAALGALALMMMPNIANSDATRKGAGEVQAALKISQAMAGTARLPRGVRLLPNLGLGGTLCTEMQYLESPPVMVADPQVLVAKPGDPSGVNTPNGPRVEFAYEFVASASPTGPPQGTIVNRHCYIYGLNQDQLSQIGYGATLVLPTLGAWSMLKNNPSNQPYTVVTTTPQLVVEVYLDLYPDTLLGAASQLSPIPAPATGQVPPQFRTYHFGIYGPPVPLVGEPTVQLPQNIAIDLSMCFPLPPAPLPTYYDILFSPSGQLVVTPTNPGISSSSALLLWVRDYTKKDITGTMPLSMQPISNAPWRFDPSFRQFELGGEQMIVGVRNGFVGTAPVLWPDGTGNYALPSGPYGPALQQLD